ncbi:hypothetical protein MIND_00644400 [Mycena indigotica]|uniref:BTB domain-containing protein n=1 Tax=Mycena indigotica TaxID=2126181 RepID=A0A8H6W749_9AGAR|nr:uncharacterized protein MIND_00644400 [Mycena indigotica]KAF7304128.1 hypothetical protein MIND_00644400 [Mycena indigotica]
MSDSSEAPNAPQAAPPRTTSEIFNDPSADVILISSDQVEFHLHRVVLGLVSPIFRTMFTLPQPQAPDAHVKALPKVRMSESSAVLEHMLALWYPGVPPPTTTMTLAELEVVLELVILKYDMQSLITIAQGQLRNFLASDALAVFAVAMRHSWQDLAKEAAKECLKLPLRTSTYALPASWKHLSPHSLHRLLQYHIGCHEALTALAKTSAWDYDYVGWPQCPNCSVKWTGSGTTTLGTKSFFKSLLSKLAQEYQYTPGRAVEVGSLSFQELVLRLFNTECGPPTTCYQCRYRYYQATISTLQHQWPQRLIDEFETLMV